MMINEIINQIKKILGENFENVKVKEKGRALLIEAWFIEREQFRKLLTTLELESFTLTGITAVTTSEKYCRALVVLCFRKKEGEKK
mgnify:CR=1 FL=1